MDWDGLGWVGMGWDGLGWTGITCDAWDENLPPHKRAYLDTMRGNEGGHAFIEGCSCPRTLWIFEQPSSDVFSQRSKCCENLLILGRRGMGRTALDHSGPIKVASWMCRFLESA